MLTVVLCVAAFVAGLTGSWSPCGFSMISSLGSHAQGRRVTLLSCLAFAPGALAGGVLTFGALSLLGALLGAGDAALAVAALFVAVAALLELAGRPITPQIRRQVPEHWRRVLPLPVAALGYGVLLGMGFTTFVLTFAVPALAGVALAVGDPAVGLLVGLAFGAGRALPVVALAPLAGAPLGIRATELMAERPGILRGFRVADAAALAFCAVALGAQTAEAATRAHVRLAADPSVAPGAMAWHVPGANGKVAAADGFGPADVAGSRPVVGGAHLALFAEGEVRVAERATGAQVLAVPADGADALAVSDRWLVLRRPTAGGDTLVAVSLSDGAARTVATAPRPWQLGRPALDGDRLVHHVAGVRSTRIDEVDLASGARRTLRRTHTRRALSNPSVLGPDLLYVETTAFSQSLVLSRGGGRRVLLRIAPAISADKGYTTDHGPHRRLRRPTRPAKEGPPGTTTTLWTTALAPDAAYVTRLRSGNGRTRADLLRVAR